MERKYVRNSKAMAVKHMAQRHIISHLEQPLTIGVAMGGELYVFENPQRKVSPLWSTFEMHRRILHGLKAL